MKRNKEKLLKRRKGALERMEKHINSPGLTETNVKRMEKEIKIFSTRI